MNFNPPTRYQTTRVQFQFPNLSATPEALVASLPPSLTKYLEPFDFHSCWLSTYEARRYHSRKLTIKRLASETPGDLNFQPLLHHSSSIKRFPNVHFNCCSGALDDVLLLNTRMLFRWQVSRCPAAGCLNPWHAKVDHPWPEVALRMIQENPRYALSFVPRRASRRHGMELPAFDDIARLPVAPTKRKGTKTPPPPPPPPPPEPDLTPDFTDLLPDLIELAHTFPTRTEAQNALAQEGYPDHIINQALDAVRKFQT